jgi:hypothetical protein
VHIGTKNKIKHEFIEKYSKDFDITGGGFIKTFLGMDNRSIKMHLDYNFLIEYTGYNDPSVFQCRLESSSDQRIDPLSRTHPNKSFTALPDPAKLGHTLYRSLQVVAKLQFASSWIRFDISMLLQQLARFCASAGSGSESGSPHWAALHHLTRMEGLPSFNLPSRSRTTTASRTSRTCSLGMLTRIPN